ncbi:MAG: hypothetical protein ABIO46_16170, partial [Chitinophagales bacterium]
MKKGNPTLLRKLTSYSAMAGSIIAVAGTANAQAIYTDIDPDVTVNETGFGYFIDFDNDGNKEFAIGFFQTNTAGGYLYNKVFARPYNGSIAGSAAGNYVYPSAMIAGEMIDNNLDWHAESSQTMGAGFILTASSSLVQVFGKWYGVEDRYLPLRFKIATDTHYGWARLDVPGLIKSFTIKDMAYNPIANEGLFAGQGDPTDVQITPMPESVKIFAYDGIVNTVLFN